MQTKVETISSMADLSIYPEGWGIGDLDDIKILLQSNQTFFNKYVDNENLNKKPIVVMPSTLINNDYPMIVKGATTNTIYLNTKDTNWSQYCYQFAHEYCHHIIGKVYAELDRFGWFEETLCELASIHSMLHMAERWNKGYAPYENWHNYSDSLKLYAENIINKNEIFYDGKLSEWIKINETILHENRYDRIMNRFVAIKILEVFVDNPGLWNLLPFLNEIKVEENKMDFKTYIKEWGRLIPRKNRSEFRKLRNLLLD